MDPFKNHKQYFLFGLGTGASVQLISGALGMLSGSKARKRAAAKAKEQAQQALTRQTDARARLDEQKARYLRYQFQNPFEGMENPFEDLRVSTKTADFQMEQAAQQRANILAGLRGAAGTSGIAGLAQALANQGVIQARQVSADIAKQEAANEAARAKGTLIVDKMRREGEAAVQQAESAREATVLGMELGAMTGASQAMQQTQANLAYQNVAGMQMRQQNALALTGLLGTDGPFSDIFGGGQQPSTASPYTGVGSSVYQYEVDPIPGIDINIGGTIEL